MKLLIIGHKRHGKDTMAEMINKHFGMTFTSSSQAAADIFIYDRLKDKYGYTTPEECFEDRVNHRSEWYDLITDFNKTDRARLAKLILEHSNMYVGMRDHDEISECKKQGLFDYVIGVFDPRKELEDSDSFNIDIWKESDLIIPNSGTLEQFNYKILNVLGRLL